jgi:hypothetical protein
MFLALPHGQLLWWAYRSRHGWSQDRSSEYSELGACVARNAG